MARDKIQRENKPQIPFSTLEMGTKGVKSKFPVFPIDIYRNLWDFMAFFEAFLSFGMEKLNRQSNFEILRILAMAMIVSTHAVWRSNQLHFVNGLFGNHLA